MRDPTVVTSPRGQEEKSSNSRQYALLNDTNSAKNDPSDHNRPPQSSKSPAWSKTSAKQPNEVPNDNNNNNAAAASNPNHQSCTDSSLSESSDLSESSGADILDKTVANAKPNGDEASSKDAATAYHHHHHRSRAKGAASASQSSASRNTSNAKQRQQQQQIEPKFYISINNLQMDFSTEWLKRILLDRLGSNNNVLNLTKYTRRDACVKVSSEAVQKKAVRTLHRLRIGGRPLSCRKVANPRKLFERYGIYKGLVEDLSDASNYSHDNSISESSSSSYYSSSRHHSASHSSGHDSCSDYSTRRKREPAAKAHKSSMNDSGSREQRSKRRQQHHSQRSRSYSPGSSSGSVRGSPVYEGQGDGAETSSQSKRFGRSFDSKASRNDLGSSHDPLGVENRLSNGKIDRGIRNYGDNKEILSHKYQYLDKPDTEPYVFNPSRQKKDKIFKIAISATNQDVDASQSSKPNQAGTINKIDEIPNSSPATTQDQKPPANTGIVGSDTNVTARPSVVEKPVAYSPVRPVGNVFGDANSSPEENSGLKSTSIARKQQSRLQNLNKSHDDLKNFDKLESVSPKVRKQARGNDDDADTSSLDKGKTVKASHNSRSDRVKHQSPYYRHKNKRQHSESLTSSSNDTSCSLSSESTSCTRSSSPSYSSRSPRRNNLRNNRFQYRKPAVTTNTKSYNILDGEAEKSETFITRNFSTKTGAEFSRSETESNIDDHQVHTNGVSHHSNQEVVEISKQIDPTAIGVDDANLPLNYTPEDIEYIIEIVRKLSVIMRDPKLDAILAKISANRSSRADEPNSNDMNCGSPPCASDVDLDYSKLEGASKIAVKTLVQTNADENLELDKIHQEVIGKKQDTVAAQVADAIAHEIRSDSNVPEVGRDVDKSSNLEYCAEQDECDILDSCSQNEYDESCGYEAHSNEEEVSAPIVRRKKSKKAKNQIKKRKAIKNDNSEHSTHKSKKHKGKHLKQKSQDKDKKFKKMIQKVLKQKLGGSATKIKPLEENSYQSSDSLSNANDNSKEDKSTDDDNDASTNSFSSQDSSIESPRPNKFSKSDLKELLKFYERSKIRPKRVLKSKEKKSREIEEDKRAKSKSKRGSKSHKVLDRVIGTEIPKKLELATNSKTSIDKSKGRVKEKDKSHATRKALSKRKHAK